VKRSHDALDGSDADVAATTGFAAELFTRVARDIAGFNPAGFCDAAKYNMYPFA
jgi:hypothetical protein